MSEAQLRVQEKVGEESCSTECRPTAQFLCVNCISKHRFKSSLFNTELKIILQIIASNTV